ncbi:MAG: hypothetical protein J0I93_03490 [Legionella sp.]|nr:hypothetical protein [Legionella sp.]
MSTLEQEVRIIIGETNLLAPEVTYGERLMHLFHTGRQGLSLAKIAEAHWDALAILAEAQRTAAPGTLYAVWASEAPDHPLRIEINSSRWYLSGIKRFCSGAGLVDRALITVEDKLLDISLTDIPSEYMVVDHSQWCSQAFAQTNTATLTFNRLPLSPEVLVGENHWYVKRLGFWRGALGPAACWGGGAASLVDYAQENKRDDAHTLAHLGAMAANIWTIEKILLQSGKDAERTMQADALQRLALMTRHLIEQLATDTLRRFARAYGPYPIACIADINQQYQELDLFLKQHHGERDLAMLGKLIKNEQS